MKIILGIYHRLLIVFLFICLMVTDVSWVNAQEVVADTITHELPNALLRRKRMVQQRFQNGEKQRPTNDRADLKVKQRDGNFSYKSDSTDIEERVDSIVVRNKDNLNALEMPIDTTNIKQELVMDTLWQSDVVEKKVFIPDPAKATWLAVVFPGGGQIYNRKYWKLPIFYGGFVGCAYALTWNGQMYSDYSQAYLDIMDDNPETDSFLDFLPPGYDVNSNSDYLKKVFKRKKDSYRRYRDLSIFCFIGVYIVSIIDAYVDAELASFDISQDLTLKLEPTIIQNNRLNLREGNSYGLQCRLRF